MSVIDDIKSRLDIVEIIGETVQLRKAGRAYVGFCPFHHNTRTPAFTVYPDTQSFYCFGCHAAGSVFDFVMRKQGLDFPEVLQQLAHHAGVQLKERKPEEQQEDHRRTRLLDLNASAARYFNYLLLQHRRGQPGRDYLARRGLSTETIEQFQLGYSLNEWDHLLTALIEKKGFTHEEIVAAGLAVQREEGGCYDRFRGRLMFPIRSTNGEVVGFGGRAIGDAQPKYLNTPQTLLFDKSRILYGLDRARDAIRSNDAVVIVEGYVDVLTAHQYGFHNVVAPLGTALTAGHVGLLKKLTHTVYLALDADAAGQRATLRGIHTLQHAPGLGDEDVQPVGTAQGLVRWESDISLYIIKMPAGKDPDEVIKANPQQWNDLVAAAVPVVDFYLDAYTADLDLSRPNHQRQALDRLLPIIAQLDGTQQRVYVARLEHLVGIKAELLLDLVRSNEVSGAGRPERQESRHEPEPAVQGTEPGAREQRLSPRYPADPHLVALDYRVPPRPSHEDWLLALVLRYPSTFAAIEQVITRDLASFPQMQELFGFQGARLLEKTENRLIWQAWTAAGSPPLPEMPYNPSDPLIAWIQGIDSVLRSQVDYLAGLKLPRPTEYLYRQEAEQCARTVRFQQVQSWIRRLSQQAHVGEDPDKQKRMQDLLAELGRYRTFLATPPVNRNYADVRSTLEREL